MEYSLQTYVAKGAIRNVADKNPSNLKHALPLVRRPDSTASCIVDLEGFSPSTIN